MIETTSLKIERLPAARGIVTPQPEFTWALTADRDGERQTACQIEVDRLAPGGGASPAWRSDKRVGLIGDEVRYAGEPLASRTNYRWRVRVWNCDDQASTWSAWAAFETGVIAPDQIAGQWIAGGGEMRELGSGRHQNIAWKSPAKNMSNTSPTTAGQTAVRSEYKLKTTGDFALPADWSLYRPDGFVLPRLTSRPAGHNVAQENQAHPVSRRHYHRPHLISI